jgi:hypothetical protein
LGVGCRDLELMISLKKQGVIPKRGAVMEVGGQQLANHFLYATHLIEEIAELFDAKLPHPFPSSLPSYMVHGGVEALNDKAPPSKIFWNWIGYRYKAIDIDGSEESIELDLNYDSVPKREKGQYQIVTNYGTTEHIANQLNAFKIIHDLTAVGGIMIHNLPAQGFLNHGLVNYNPKFFWMLARSNGYRWHHMNYSQTSEYPFPENIVDHVAQFNPDITERASHYQYGDGWVVVVLQKLSDEPYVPPLDVPTGTKTKSRQLLKRYPTVLKQA